MFVASLQTLRSRDLYRLRDMEFSHDSWERLACRFGCFSPSPPGRWQTSSVVRRRFDLGVAVAYLRDSLLGPSASIAALPSVISGIDQKQGSPR